MSLPFSQSVYVAVVVAGLVCVGVVVDRRNQSPVTVVADLVGRAGLSVEHLGDSLVSGHDFCIGLFSVLFAQEVAAIGRDSSSLVLDLFDFGAFDRPAGSDILFSCEGVGLYDCQRLEICFATNIELEHVGERLPVRLVYAEHTARHTGEVVADLETHVRGYLPLRPVILQLGKEIMPRA